MSPAVCDASAVTIASVPQHITKHHGPTNKKLRLHLPLCGTDGSRLRVGSETRPVVAGQPFVFDDSFEHEAWHDGSETRITLIIDIWHPDLTDREVRFLSGLQKSKMRAEKRRSMAAKSEVRGKAAEAAATAAAAQDEAPSSIIDDGCDDFFALLRKTRGMSADDTTWSDTCAVQCDPITLINIVAWLCRWQIAD